MGEIEIYPQQKQIPTSTDATSNSGHIDRRELFRGFPDVVGIAEICKMLGIGKGTATRLLKEGKIPYIQIGREYKVAKPDVINFVLNVPMNDEYFMRQNRL